MGDWIGYVLTAVGTIGGVFGVWGTWKVTHRAQEATERNLEHEQDDKLLASYKGGVETFERLWNTERRERETLEERVSTYRAEQLQERDEHERTKHELRALQADFDRLKGRLLAALNLIREWMEWGDGATHSRPRPVAPETIADLIITRDKP